VWQNARQSPHSQEGWGPQPEQNVVLGRLARARRAAFLGGFSETVCFKVIQSLDPLRGASV